MNILHVTLGFFPAESWGGPVKVAYRTCSELVRRGHTVTVYCTNLLDKKTKIQPGTFERDVDGIRVIYFNTWNFKWWPGTLGPFWLPELPKVIKREISNFDVVHLHGYRSFMVIPIVKTAQRSGIPIVTQPHGALPVTSNTLWLKRAYDRIFQQLELKNIGALIALQESERKSAIAAGIPDEKIRIIPNGIDPKQRESLPEPGTFRKHFNLPGNCPIILFIGRINKIKGPDMLVDAFSKLACSNAHLVIAGPDDGQLAEIKDLVKQHELMNRVTFTGLLSGEDVLSAFQDADLFVLPSRYDAFPTTIIEACLVGTPMVITDRCMIANLVKGEIGEVVPFDAQAFADAMDLLLSNHERYQRYKQNTQKVLAETFSIGAVVNKIETVYRNVINDKISDKNN